MALNVYQTNHAIRRNRSRDLFQRIAWFVWYTFTLCRSTLLPPAGGRVENTRNFSGGRVENTRKFSGGSSEVLLGRSAKFPGIGFGRPGQFQISLRTAASDSFSYYGQQTPRVFLTRDRIHIQIQPPCQFHAK